MRSAQYQADKVKGQEMNVWERWAPRVPTIEEVADAERRYAAACRLEAQRIEGIDPDHAALLLLDADLCEMWANELESGSVLGQREYEDAVRQSA